MAFVKKDFESLKDFLPANTFDTVFEYIKTYGIQLTITKERHTIHGNFRFNPKDNLNKISVNGSLNKYAFLITLLHEIAHCITLHQNGYNVPPHGTEWQSNFSAMLQLFINQDIFPTDINYQLQKTSIAPKASSCADADLERVLLKYNENKEDNTLVAVEQLPIGTYFLDKNKNEFYLVEKRRTKYLCHRIKDNKMYLFPALYTVQPLLKK